MKGKFFVAGILAFALVFGMMVVGCDDGNSNPESVTYSGYDADGNVYTLVVTENPNRAITPQAGDSYVLTIKDSTETVIGKSTGTVKAVTDGELTLEKDGAEFSVVISGSSITAITNNIPLDGGGTRTPPDSLSPNEPTTDTKSDWKGDQNGNGTLTFAWPDDNNNWGAKINENWLFNGYQIQAGDKFRLTYAFTSNYEGLIYCWSSLVDTTKEADWWTRLTPETNYDFKLTRGTTHTGSIEYPVLKSAVNNSSDASVLYFWVWDWDEKEEEKNRNAPLIWNFTKFELEKIEAE